MNRKFSTLQLKETPQHIITRFLYVHFNISHVSEVASYVQYFYQEHVHFIWGAFAKLWKANIYIVTSVSLSSCNSSSPIDWICMNVHICGFYESACGENSRFIKIWQE